MLFFRIRWGKSHGRFLLGVQNILLGLVGGMLGVPIWLFWMATWSMVHCGIGLCLCLLFGIDGIIGIVGRWKTFKIFVLTIGRLCTVLTSMWIFDFPLLSLFLDFSCWLSIFGAVCSLSLAGLGMSFFLAVSSGRRIWQGKRWSGGAEIGLLVVFFLQIRFF